LISSIFFHGESSIELERKIYLKEMFLCIDDDDLMPLNKDVALKALTCVFIFDTCHQIRFLHRCKFSSNH